MDRPAPRPSDPPSWQDADAWVGVDETAGTGMRERLLRPWLEPRPGELRGAVVLLAGALALTGALWFDASRRPEAAAVPVPVVEVSGPAGAPVGAVAPGGGAPGGGARAPASDPFAPGGPLGPAAGPTVHVTGAVALPGLLTLAPGARVGDAVAAAGGALPDAWLDRVNLARPVADGEQVHVPRVGEDAPPPAASGPTSQGILPDGRVDLNRATAEELATLPGIGPARAAAIIAAREEQPFDEPGDLRRVPGIGEATFQRLAPLVAVR
ncbi:MAG: hypothetical protein RLZZ353_534 [Actinomycetota bacterium]|jgi:competence protein ComEA